MIDYNYIDQIFSFCQNLRACPGVEPGTSRTLSENHTPRPKSQLFSWNSIPLNYMLNQKCSVNLTFKHLYHIIWSQKVIKQQKNCSQNSSKTPIKLSYWPNFWSIKFLKVQDIPSINICMFISTVWPTKKENYSKYLPLLTCCKVKAANTMNNSTFLWVILYVNLSN